MVNPLVIEGKKALTMEGISFAMAQIAAGLNEFAPILQIDLGQFSNISPPNKEELVETESDNDDAEDESDEDCVNDVTLDLDENDEKASSVLSNVHSVSVNQSCEIFGERLADGVFYWQFPGEISQGRYKGRNGSSACSVISLVLGCIINKQNIPLPLCTPPYQLTSVFVKALCGAIELGNHVYDVCRESLPARFLTIEEAASALRPWFTISADDALPVRLTDDHQLSTLCGQLSEVHDNCTACIIINDRSSLLYTSI